MLKIKSKIKLIGNVLDIILNDEKDYLFVDQYYRIYKFSLKNFSFSFTKRVAKNAEPHHKYSKAISCSSDSYVILPKTKSSIGSIYKIDNNQITLAARLKWHRADICVSKFSKDNKYLATGGEDGRVFVYTHPSHKFYTFLNRKPDYISAIAFGKNSDYIAYASYDLTLTVYNLNIESETFITKTPSVIEDMAFFDNNKKIFYACKDGQTGVYDIIKNKNKFEETLCCWPTKMMLNTDETYAYIGTREDVIYIHNIQNNFPAWEIKTSFKGITCIKEFEEVIFIGFVNGTIEVVDTFYQTDDFLKLLAAGDYEEAKVFAEENNILLKTLKVYSDVKNHQWKLVLKDAISLIKNNQIENALNIAQPYFEDKDKRKQFREIVEKKSFVKKFLKAYEEKDYKSAYFVADQHPCIKSIGEYQKMEDEFEKIYQFAQKLLIEDVNNNKAKIKLLFEKFDEVDEKKKIINVLFNNAEKYIMAEKYAKAKDYENYFILVLQVPFLKSTQTYQRVYYVCEELVNKIQTYISNKEYTKALENIKLILNLEPFKEYATKTQKYLDNITQFIEKYNQKNYSECYKLLEICPELESTEEYTEMFESIMKIFEEAKKLAQKADVKHTLEKISVFLNTEYWKSKVEATIKIAYLYEMQKEFELNSITVDWERTIKKYIGFYGKDDEIKNFCTSLVGFEKNLDNIKEDKISNMSYVPSIIIRKGEKNS